MAKTAPFERFTEQYEEWFEKNGFAYESELQAIRMLLPDHGESLEIGVGTGRFAVPLGIGIGVEPAAAMRAVARKRGVEVIDGHAEALPFPGSRFDYAQMVTTICFVDDVEISLKEAHRVLKPGGCLVLGFIDKDSPVGLFYQACADKSLFYREATFYSTAELLDSLKRAGFEDFRFAQTIFNLPSEITEPEPVKEGHNEGSFVVIRAGRR